MKKKKGRQIRYRDTHIAHPASVGKWASNAFFAVKKFNQNNCWRNKKRQEERNEKKEETDRKIKKTYKNERKKKKIDR